MHIFRSACNGRQPGGFSYSSPFAEVRGRSQIAVYPGRRSQPSTKHMFKVKHMINDIEVTGAVHMLYVKHAVKCSVVLGSRELQLSCYYFVV